MKRFPAAAVLSLPTLLFFSILLADEADLAAPSDISAPAVESEAAEDRAAPASEAETTDEEPGKNAEGMEESAASEVMLDDIPEEDIVPELTLEKRIEDLLKAIKVESPEVYRRMNELPPEEALARIMQALDSGVVPASASAAEEKMPFLIEFWERDFRKYPVFGLTDRMFPYLRFDAVTPNMVNQAVRELEELTGGTAPEGVIVDLREATVGINMAVDALAEAVRKLGCPVMALVSGKTARQGELLAAVLRRDCGAVLVGTETAGCIFYFYLITVNDASWFVPDIPSDGFHDISPYALKPDLEKNSEVRLSFDELKEKPNRLDGDPVLRLAADLLTMKAAVKPVE